jgi:hypothetical protein
VLNRTRADADPADVDPLSAMVVPQPLPPPLRYDAVRRRVWLFGQRCHHGATGAVLTATALGCLLTARLSTRGGATLVATGSLLMAHDWKDRAIWFERGEQE